MPIVTWSRPRRCPWPDPTAARPELIRKEQAISNKFETKFSPGGHLLGTMNDVPWLEVHVAYVRWDGITCFDSITQPEHSSQYYQDNVKRGPLILWKTWMHFDHSGRFIGKPVFVVALFGRTGCPPPRTVGLRPAIAESANDFYPDTRRADNRSAATRSLG